MTVSNIEWAEQVAAATPLNDRRLQKRLASVLIDTVQNPLSSIPQAAGGDASQAKAAYRFYANPRVTSDAVHRGFALETAQRCLAQESVLIVQDTTTLNFTGLNSIEELGPIDSGNFASGLHLHTTLAVKTTGQVIGILDQQCWGRPQPTLDAAKKHPRKKTCDETESAKWINGLDGARQILYEAAAQRTVPRLIHLMDREGDAYEVMMAIEEAGDSAIIRCAQNRRIEHTYTKAHEAVRSQPLLCENRLTVKRKGPQTAREAEVQVRAMPIRLTPNLQKHPHAWPMTWQLVEVWEASPPLGVEPLHWLLWTREPVATAAQALEVVRQYTCRWPIEEMHLVLKSGCKTEELRLGSWAGLAKAVRLHASVAAQIVSLRDVARETPQAPALTVLRPVEVQALVSHFSKGTPIRVQALTMAQALLWIGRLGGHLNRKGDGSPGVRSLWRGLQALTLLVAGFRAAQRVLE